MKKIFYISSIIVLSAIISSCAKEENAETPTPQVNEQGTHTVVIHAVDGTKTAIYEGEKAKFVWSEDDYKRLTITENDKVGIIDQDNFSLSTKDELDKRILTFTASFPDPEQNPDNYVYKAVLASKDEDGNPTLTVPSEQTSDGFSYDPDADILISEDVTKDIRPDQDNPLEMRFYRPVAVNKMTLKGLTAGETVKTVKITSTKPLTGTYNIANNSWSDNSTEIIINTNQTVPDNGEDKGNVTVFFTTMPVEEEDGTSLTIDIMTQTSNGTYFYKKQFAADKTIKFKHNTVTRFGVSSFERVSVAELTQGETSTLFYSIEEAFAEANSSSENSTIKLLANCSTSNVLALNNTEFILNLNNHILTVNPKTTENGIELINSALTITDDSNEKKGRINFVYNSSTSTSAVSIDEKSTLSINNGELLTNLGNVVYNKGTLIMSGGSVTTNKPGDGRCVQNIGGTFTLSGGNIESTRFGIYNGTDGTLIINCDDGVPSITANSESTDSYPFALYLVAKSDANITGGVFSSNWTTSTNCRPIYSGSATGYTKTISGGTYQVKATNDISEASKITCFNGTTIIDINGKTISTSVAQFITLSENSTLTIKDKSEDKGMIRSTANYVVFASGKEKTNITIDNCQIIQDYTYNGTVSSPRKFTEFGSCVYIAGSGTSSKTNNILSIKNGAKIQSKGNNSRALASQYATVNLNECYITSKSYRAFDSTSGSVITINDGASLYSESSPAYYNRSTNTAGHITIKGGYFKGKDYAINSASNGNSIMSYSGGYFNCTDNSTTPVGSNARPDNLNLTNTPISLYHIHYLVEGESIVENSWYTIQQ